MSGFFTKTKGRPLDISGFGTASRALSQLLKRNAWNSEAVRHVALVKAVSRFWIVLSAA
jgi:hypothetical protein